MRRLTPTGRPHLSRETKFSGANEDKEKTFSCSASREQDWQPYLVEPHAAGNDDHTYTAQGLFFWGGTIIGEKRHKNPMIGFSEVSREAHGLGCLLGGDEKPACPFLVLPPPTRLTIYYLALYEESAVVFSCRTFQPQEPHELIERFKWIDKTTVPSKSASTYRLGYSFTVATSVLVVNTSTNKAFEDYPYNEYIDIL